MHMCTNNNCYTEEILDLSTSYEKKDSLHCVQYCYLYIKDWISWEREKKRDRWRWREIKRERESGGRKKVRDFLPPAWW